MDTEMNIKAQQAGAMMRERGAYPSEAEESAVRQTHLMAEIGKLDDEVERLGVVVVHLEDRLGPVLNPNPTPGTLDATLEQEATIAERAARVREARYRVASLAGRLRDVAERLEV